MVEAVVILGVMPDPNVIEGVTEPDQSIALAPPPLFPVQKNVAVPEPPVPAGKSIFATGETLPPVTVHPPDVRATLTRVYEVYVVSDVDMVPLSPGSAVCSESTMFVSGDDEALIK